MNEPELGAGINPGMAFNPFPSSILVKTRQDSNSQPLDYESSLLTTRPDLRPFGPYFFEFLMTPGFEPVTRFYVFLSQGFHSVYRCTRFFPSFFLA